MKYSILSLLLCIFALGCAHDKSNHSELVTFHKDAILILDNSGGYSHPGWRLELLKNGQLISTSYTDAIGHERKRFGTYYLADDTLVIKFGDRGTQTLKKIRYSDGIYWVYPDEVKKLLKPKNSWMRQISLRQKSEQDA